MKPLNLKSVLTLVIALTVSTGVFAHSGHGTFEDSVLHYIYSYQHLVALLLAAIGVFAVYKIYKRIKA